jgi:protein-S-isoprenylcysteine O-methyltransferase Ste14
MTSASRADLLIRGLAAAGLSVFAVRMPMTIASGGFSMRLLFLFVAEVFTVLLLLTARPAKAVNRSPLPAAAALVATFNLLFIELDRGDPLLPAEICVPLQAVGIALQLVSKAFLGRAFDLFPANRGIVTRGPYRLVRHPIYLGYFLNHVGFLLSSFTVLNAAIYTAVYLVQGFRMIEEEKVLRGDPEYADYMARVRFRFLPPFF